MVKNVKQVLFIIFCIAAFISLMYLLLCLVNGTIQNTESIYSLLSTILNTIGAYFTNNNDIDKIPKNLKNIKPEDKNYKILLIGRAGVGKTTILKTAFLFDDLSHPTTSTEEFDTYKRDIPLNLKDLKNDKLFHLEIADYKGQDPTQIVNNAPETFFGSKENREINAILFIVDIFPRGRSDNHILENDDLLESLKVDTKERIQARVNQNYSYIGEAALKMFLHAAYSSRLNTVRLIINKVNLLEKLVDDGYISLGEKTVEQYVELLYKDMKDFISKACEENDISDFSTIVINAKDANDTRYIFSNLIEKHKKKILEYIR